MSRKYEKYRPSGLEWIREIPLHWEVVPLKRLLSEKLKYGTNETAESENISWPRYISITDIDQSGKLEKDTVRSLAPKKAKDYMLNKGDVLFARSGANVGKTFLYNSTEPACFASSLIKAVCGKLLFPKYLMYFTQTNSYNNWINSVYVQATIPNIGIDKYAELPLPLPSMEEQQKIASYLDEKCSSIDVLISEMEQQLKELQQLRLSEISRVITKGLNSEVTMKDSKLDWLGEIPMHWNVVPLKRLLSENLKYGANETAESENTSWPRYIRITDIDQSGKLKKDTFKSLAPKKAKDYMLNKGDVLFARSGATVGKTFLYNSTEPACFASSLIKAVCGKLLFPKYLMYFTQSNSYDNWKNSVLSPTTIPNIETAKYAELPLPLISMKEQQAMTTYLDDYTTKIDSIISEVQLQISDLKSYKNSVISEAVTGKISLTD